MEPEYIRDDGHKLSLRGQWVIDRSEHIRDILTSKEFDKAETINASAIEKMDMWGAMQLQSLGERTGAAFTLNEQQKRIFEFLPMHPVPLPASNKDKSLSATIKSIGKSATTAWETAQGAVSMIGRVSVCFAKCILHPKSFRIHSIVRHIEETGIRAVPIIALLAVLISMVISYQAATQLQKFGASIFTVDLTVISILREMGVLTTAIMVAGRSGSAFAAEIGVMKLREEIDALKTMGMEPVEILILPRLIAMMITLPLLAFIADITGLAGGGLISIMLLDIPIDQYIDRVDSVAKPTMFFVGIIKAPVFAFIITIIGAYQGMNVSGSAESAGRLTTIAVVQSIFLVIMTDALFSIIFSHLGI